MMKCALLKCIDYKNYLYKATLTSSFINNKYLLNRLETVLTIHIHTE